LQKLQNTKILELKKVQIVQILMEIRKFEIENFWKMYAKK
jgi:hypothetical protein